MLSIKSGHLLVIYLGYLEDAVGARDVKPQHVLDLTRAYVHRSARREAADHRVRHVRRDEAHFEKAHRRLWQQTWT